MKSGLFSTSMPGNLSSAMPHDQWLKMIMNKGSKRKGGWIGITNNEAALHINTTVVNNITKVKESLKSVAITENRQFKHTECSPTRMIDTKAVERVINVLHEWGTKP